MSRRHITTAVTMLTLIAILVAGAVWGWRSLFAEVPETATVAEPGPTCTTETFQAGQRIRTRQVRVSVFNAGSTSGLAGDTLAKLRRRGFLAGETGNAPSDLGVRRVQVWSTVENDPRAELVARQFGRNVRVRFSDEDLGPGVDVIVGDRFQRLEKAPRAIEVRRTQEVCLPIATIDPDVIPEG